MPNADDFQLDTFEKAKAAWLEAKNEYKKNLKALNDGELEEGEWLSEFKLAKETYFKAVAEKKASETAVIPYIHPKIKLQELVEHQDGIHRVLSKDEMISLRKSHGSKPDGVYFLNNHCVIKDNQKYYVMHGNIGHEEKKLGAGAFGSVHLMQDISTGEWIAAKLQKIPHDREMRGREQLIKNENESLNTLGQFKFNHAINSRNEKWSFTGMKLAAGASVESLVDNPSREYPPVRWFDMSISMLAALQKIHLALLLHCDIKPANMNFDPVSHEVTFVDLGGSISMKNGSPQDWLKSTPGYVAPELIKEQREGKREVTYSEKTDIYALGKTMAEFFGLAERTYQPFDVSLVSRENPVFRDNTHIPDYAIRVQVLYFLKRMIEDDPQKRPSLADAMKFFNNIRAELLSAPALVNHVVHLNVEEYKNATLPEKEKIETELKKADEVWLVDSQQKHKSDYTAIKKDLENRNIIVSNEVIQHKKMEPMDTAVRNHASKREEKDNNIYICRAITKQGVVAHPVTVSETHVNKIINALQKDMNRLLVKYGKDNPRIKETQKTINELRKDVKNLSYSGLDQSLNKLQNKLYAENKLQRVAEILSGNRYGETKSRQVVKDLQEETRSLMRPGR